MLSMSQRQAIEAIKDGRSVIFKVHFPHTVDIITTERPAVSDSTFVRTEGSEYACRVTWSSGEHAGKELSSKLPD